MSSPHMTSCYAFLSNQVIPVGLFMVESFVWIDGAAHLMYT